MKLVSIIILIIHALTCVSQIRITINQLPANTPIHEDIYLAGSINGWNPKDEAFKFIKGNDGKLSLEFTPASNGTIQYKCTRGSWEKVESNEQGSYLPNRTISYIGVLKEESINIMGWEGNSSNPSTASPQVRVLSESFAMPQLGLSRRVWIYLPKNYDQTQKYYPVVYMHDGQNLFDKATSFSGEWKVDETLDSLYLEDKVQSIIIGIDNGAANRLNEYSPWNNPNYGGGQGDVYIQWIINNLKSYVDQNFRTLPDNANTAIIGSSMGGLISMYAGVKYPHIFGKVGAFSSSFWFSKDCETFISGTDLSDNMYVYMIAGEKEGGTQVVDMLRVASIIEGKMDNENHLYYESHVYGGHNESYWAKEFPKAYMWLMEKKTSGSSSTFGNNISYIIENQAIRFLNGFVPNNKNIAIFDIIGREIGRYDVSVGGVVQLPIEKISNQYVFIVFYIDNKKVTIPLKYN